MAFTKVTYSMIAGAPLNVLDFGAKGDGTTNDRAAIQAAVTALSAGQTLVLPAGYTFNVVNATGTGATIVDQRANAVSNNTLYAITSSTNNITIQIDGAVVSTSALDDVFRFTGTGVTVCGSGSVTGPGVYLDTNSSDTAQQWYPSLVKLSGNESSCENLTIANAPAIGIYLNSNRSKAVNNTIIGGPASHGTGTVSFGICLGATTGGNAYCSAIGNRFTVGSDDGAMYDAIFSVCYSSVITDNIGYGLLEHGVYNYGSYSVISNNRFGGLSTRVTAAAAIQNFAFGCTISNNVLSYCTGGIALAACANTTVTGNNMSVGIALGGISVRRYTSDATSTTYENIVIFNNVFYVPGITQQAIDVAVDNTITGLTISGNSITGSAATYGGITIRNIGSGAITQVKITNNYIEQCDAWAMYLVGISTFNISNNQIVNVNGTTSDVAILCYQNCYNGIVKCNQVSDNRVTTLTARIFYGDTASGNTNITVSENSGDTLKTTTDPFVLVPTSTGLKYGNTINGQPTSNLFTVTNASSATVTAPSQSASSTVKVLLNPINQAAWDLQASANRIHVQTLNAGSFVWATSSGSATGSTTAQFQYQILQ